MTYTSDLVFHLYWASDASWENLFTQYLTYPLWHVLVYYMNLYLRFSLITSQAIVSSICVISSIAVLDYYLQKHIIQPSVFNKKYLFGLAVGFNTITALYIHPYNPYFIFLSGQPWHNPTYLIMRPFAIACFFMFYELFSENDHDDSRILKRFNKQDSKIIIFCLLVFVSILAKPSFIFVFGPAAFIFAIIETIQSKQKLKKLFLIGKIGIFLMPSLVLMLVQNSVTSEGDNFNLIFAPLYVWNLHKQLPFLLSFVASFAFPLYCLCVLYKSICKNKLLLLSALTGLVGVSEFLLFAENNSRIYHANIAWSQISGTLLLFVGCFIAFANYGASNDVKRGDLWKLGGGGILLLLHIASGIYYMYCIFVNPVSYNLPVFN
jgi:hypothetical protein